MNTMEGFGKAPMVMEPKVLKEWTIPGGNVKLVCGSRGDYFEVYQVAGVIVAVEPVEVKNEKNIKHCGILDLAARTSVRRVPALAVGR